MKPVSVCHVISGDLWAGAEVQVYNLCRALQAGEDVRPTAVLFNDGILFQKLRNEGIPVDLADEAKQSPLQMIQVIRRHCRKYRSTVLHTHGFKENVLGVCAKWSTSIPRSVRTIHGNPELHHRLTKSPAKWGVHKLDVLLGRFGQDAIVGVSEQLRSTLIEVFGPKKVHKIHNFVDVAQVRLAAGLTTMGASSHTARDAHPLKLGLVGRLVPVKRVDLFLETIKRINDQGIECQGIVFGSGPLEDRLKRQAQDLAIQDSILFRGFVDPLLKELRGLDAIVMTSDHEGLPMTLLEALALEIPIIAHSQGGIPEALDQGRCGWLVGDHSPRGYGDAVIKAFTETPLRYTKTVHGLTFVQKEFGLAPNRNRYINLYRQLNKKTV